MLIMDSREQVLRRKTVRLVKVLWQHRGVEEEIWECEDTICANYPFLFKDASTFFFFLSFDIEMTVAFSCDIECVYVCEFWGRNSFKERRM